MFKSLNKGITTTIAISIIVLVVVIVGGILAWHYFGITKESNPAGFPEVNRLKGSVPVKTSQELTRETSTIDSKLDIKQVDFVKLFKDNQLSCVGFCLPEPGTKLKYDWNSSKKYTTSWWEEVGKKGAVLMKGLGISIDEFFYQDLDGGGKEEVVLNLYGGGTGGNDVFRVFKVLDSGDIIELKVDRGDTQVYPYGFSTLAPDGMGHFHFAVKENKIIEYADVYKKGDANCCPTGGMRFVVFQWDTNKKEFLIKKTLDVLPSEMGKGFRSTDILDSL